MTRIVFLGTPEAAVPTLEMLARRYEVGMVVTQPDRPKGRSAKPAPSPVKQRSLELGLDVVQPERRDEIAPALSGAGPCDLGVVVAYGMILDSEVLDTPKHGILNVHFSLLPRWRGAAPVARALMAGDTMTGVTIIKLDEGLDTGPVLTAQAVDIAPEADAGELTSRLSRLGARLLETAIPAYLAGDLAPQPQTDEGATYAHKLGLDDRPLSVDMTVTEFVNRVRGLAPDPGATLEIDEARHKVLKAAAAEATPEQGAWELVDDMPVVGVADGGVALIELQPPGKRTQAGEDWGRGRRRSRGRVG